ncbi:MAG TPA: poly-gamma-glutamate synthase PgsB [Firmicutes bacterium]|nr:poly-gamma-glutamate synthase PgsB [Bacillota bacterium]
MGIVLVLTLALLILGLRENILHRRRLKKIPLRIHVNGTRGKSTTTRLIAGMLRQAGYRVVAKTTGTAPRLILEDGTEEEIKRGRQASITEQVRIVARAAGRGADALVIECMALAPEMQWVAEKRIIKSSIGVITNVREDHLDVMGPARRDVAATLAFAIPRQGRLVVGEEEFLPLFQKAAESIGTTTYLADCPITAEEMSRFPYLMFKENVACALKVGELLGIAPNTAWQGMIKAAPDLGSTQICRLERAQSSIYFVNALAANDLVSTVLVWERWQSLAVELGLGDLPVIGLLHNRADRSFRLPELAEMACTKLPLEHLYLTGGLAPVTKRCLKKGGFDLKAVTALRKPSPQLLIADIFKKYNGGAVLFAYGNTQGFGQQLADFFTESGVQLADDRTSDRVGLGH